MGGVKPPVREQQIEEEHQAFGLAYYSFDLGPVWTEHFDLTQHSQSDHDFPTARSRPGAQLSNGSPIASEKVSQTLEERMSIAILAVLLLGSPEWPRLRPMQLEVAPGESLRVAVAGGGRPQSVLPRLVAGLRRR